MKRLLIADDQPSLRLLVSATLASDDYEIVEAADGDEAWDLIRHTRPDLALLDVQMPGKTGIELTRAIKGDDDLASTVVILLSSKAQASDVEAGLHAGADLYLTKPFSPIELLGTVDRALNI